LVAATPLSFSNSADFARYLPRSSSPVAVAGWTTAGLLIPSVIFTVVGILAGTVIDMTDPQSALGAILPSWFMPIFLLAIVIGSIAGNATTTYSSGLALQSIGVPLRRSITVLIDGTVGVAVTLYALLVSNFLDTVSSLLELLTAVVGPLMTIYVCDVLLRRNIYDGVALSDESPTSTFWYTRGVNVAGAVALIAASGVALLCISTPHYVGPIATALGGIDISLIVGIGLSATLYVGLMRTLYRDSLR
jgi:nucleobase:cation symporter-1, NCS1 family